MKRPLIVIGLILGLTLSMVGTASAADRSVPNAYVPQSSAANDAGFWVTWAASNRTDIRTGTGYTPVNWVGATVTCSKISNTGASWYTLPTPPSGQQYAMVIVKTGSGLTANGVYWNPALAAGDRVRNGNGVSHVIACYKPDPKGSILIEKTYSQTPASSASFNVTQNLVQIGAMTMSTVNNTEYHCLGNLPYGTYTVTETEPDGWQAVDPFTVTVSTETTCAARLAATTITPDTSITNNPSPVDVRVTKTKVGATGTRLPGFEFSIFEGADVDLDADPAPTALQTAVSSDAEGEVGEALFEDLTPGASYTVCETGVPTGEEGYWQVEGDECQNVAIAIDDSEKQVSFANEPLADVEIDFIDVTGYTRAEIVCYDSEGTEIDRADIGDYGDNSLDLDMLALGDYDCTIMIRDGDLTGTSGETTNAE